MLKIPLHALIMMVGPSGAGKTAFVERHFKSHEVISSDEIREELTGDFRNQHANDLVFSEFHRRVELKLGLGERVVADATHLRKKDRVKTALIGAKMHVPVIYIVVNRSLDEKLATPGWRKDVPGLIQRHEQTFLSQEADILAGDYSKGAGSLATVIDTRITGEENDSVIELDDKKFGLKAAVIEIVEKVDYYNLSEFLKEAGYDGVAVIGDVHGMAREFQAKVDEAKKSNLFVIQLGDIVDYGPDAVGALDIMYKLVVNGEGAFIIGNHERKLEKYFNQKEEGNVRIEIKGGLVKTLEQLDRLDESKVKMFESKFRALMNHARHHIILEREDGATMFVHAACSQKMWDSKANRLMGYEESRAMFGEVDQDKPRNADGFPNRVYNWVNEIPDNHRVYVGHAILSTDEILIKTGELGGKAFFVDTGSGKDEFGVEGGFLSMVEERLE